MSQKNESELKVVTQLEEQTLFEIIELEDAVLDAVTGGIDYAPGVNSSQCVEINVC